MLHTYARLKKIVKPTLIKEAAVQSKRINHYNHRSFRTELKDAIFEVAAYYAEQVRKRTDSLDEALDAIAMDERPGGVPYDLDCPAMRIAMRKHIHQAYKAVRETWKQTRADCS